jgi:hypothetical protein
VTFQKIEWIKLKDRSNNSSMLSSSSKSPGHAGRPTHAGSSWLQVALSLRHARETTAQLSPDVQRRDTLALG